MDPVEQNDRANTAIDRAVAELTAAGWKIDDADRETVWMTKDGAVIKIQID